MFYNHAFIIAYIINVYFITNNTAVNLSSSHKKRELSFNNYPGGGSVLNPSQFSNYQQNEINDPGYTTHNENNVDKTVLGERNINITSSQNIGFTNPSGQLFQLIYMPSQPQKRQHLPVRQDEIKYHQNINGNIENLAYAGPHLFPSQLPMTNQNIHQLKTPIRNFNDTYQNIFSTHLFLRPYHQNYIRDSEAPTKMEAPFIPSQFLGYDHQKQLLPQQHQYLGQQTQQSLPLQKNIKQQIQQDHVFHVHNYQLPQHNQVIQQQQQHPQKVALVHEQQKELPYQSSNLIYMAPYNMYDLYRKLN